MFTESQRVDHKIKEIPRPITVSLQTYAVSAMIEQMRGLFIGS
jgi:uncharacterized ParB-like nuclease family protein